MANFVWICSLCRLPVTKKPQFWANLDFLGAPVPTPFYRWGQNLVCYSRPTVYAYLSNFVSISLFCPLCWRKPPIFAVFWTSACSVVAKLTAVWESWTRVHNYKPPPTQRHQNRFCVPTPSWRNRAHNLWCLKAWRTNRQTNTQTIRQKLNVFGHPGGGWSPSLTKLGTVIADLEHILEPQTFPGMTHSYAARGRSKFWGTRPLNLKAPNSVTPWANPSKFLTANAS